MTVAELAARLNAKVLCGTETALERAVRGVYAGDLLSWVMGRAGAGAAWVTIMSNMNVAAVALLTEVACVVLSEGVAPDEALLARAVREDLALLSTPLPTYDVCWRTREGLTDAAVL
ncbi:MAG: hypothetical protein LBH86_08660 [Oscillospiraceae bacterium]|jgi:BioD-like phosphotransacetylase family protein|nr:hypothetical protein [Oscillospiraceae bacterium]